MNKLILKIKVKIYQYTGIYLAYKEESEYVSSKEYWKKFHKIASNPENDMSLRNIHGIQIGSWQAHNGLHRRAIWRGPRYLRGFKVFVLTLKDDVKYLLRLLWK